MDQVTLCSPALWQEIGNLGSFRGLKIPSLRLSSSPSEPGLGSDQLDSIKQIFIEHL